MRYLQPRRFGQLFAMAWLLMMGFAFADAFTNPHPAIAIFDYFLGGLTFIGAYVWFWFRAIGCGRREKVLAIGTMAVLSLVMPLALGSAWQYLALYTVVAMGAAYDHRWRRAVVAILVMTTASTLIMLAYLIPAGAAIVALAYFVEVGLIGIGTVAVGRLVTANRQLSAAREEIARLAVSEERLRFARDLHDLLGHSLSVIALKAELASKLIAAQPERAAAELSDIDHVAREALREVRDTVAGYRQPTLSQELEGSRQVLGSAGIQSSFEHGREVLPASVEGVLAWSVREGTTNVVRHSHASSCTIRVAREGDWAVVEIQDDGRGAPSLSQGSGLRGLRERVLAAGGRLDAESPDGGGFRLRVSIPTAEEEAAPVAAAR